MRRPTAHESGRRWFERLPARSKERIVDDRADGETLNGMYFCDVFDLDTSLDFRRGVRHAAFDWASLLDLRTWGGVNR